MTAPAAYLPPGLPRPAANEVDAPFWQGLRAHTLLIQHCAACGTWIWGPELICHACHAFDPSWEEVAPIGIVHSAARVWHPAHAALEGRGPYWLGVVALPAIGGLRMVGNILFDIQADLKLGMEVRGHFEDHNDRAPGFTLLQWKADVRKEGLLF